LLPLIYGAMAELLGKAGKALEAIAMMDDTLALVGRNQERWFEAETHRIKADALVSIQRFDRAEASFQQAISVARDQGARLWELRAATKLAHLWREQGRGAEARALLAPVYGTFTEGLGTLDLKRAKALLDQLN
jgi:predicted ATPase